MSYCAHRMDIWVGVHNDACVARRHHLGDGGVTTARGVVQRRSPLQVAAVDGRPTRQQHLRRAAAVVATRQVQRCHLVVSAFDVHV